MPGEIIALDVSGAPAHERDLRTIVVGFVFSFLLVCLAAIPLLIFDPNLRLPPAMIRFYYAGVFAGGLFCLLGLSALFARGAERRVQLAAYGVNLAQAKQRVFARLHRSWWAHPDLWAWVNLVLAFVAPIAIAWNEHAIVVGLGGADAWGNARWDNTIPELAAPLLALALLLNAARLYKRGLSLWAFSVPFLSYFVALPGLALLYIAGVCAIVMLATHRPLTDGDVHAVVVVFAGFPMAILFFASLLPPVKRFYDRVLERYRRLMEVVQLPSAKQALTRDKRQPLLYLRSFQVDQAWVWNGYRGKDATSRRLEDSLAAPLRELGPLVAIGKPRELAVTGAARAYYADDQWQAAIADLMDRAGFIVAVIGPTGGLAWELAAIRARNHVGKTIWVLPPDQANATLLRQKLREALAQTPYEAAARRADLDKAMAIHAVGADQLAVISSGKNTTGEYEGAIQAAVYGLTRHLIA